MLRQIRYALIVAVLVLFVSLIYVRFPFDQGQGSASPSERGKPATASPRIQIASSTVEVYVADTPEDRAKGLSGRSMLAEGEGMLFIFEEDGRHGFWMKDMRFSIDIVWISGSGVIVDLEENVGPETYPVAFVPIEEARYVLELPAGWMERHRAGVGDIVRL